MKLLKSKFVALIVALAVVAGSVFGNTYFMLGDECDELEASFYVTSGASRGIYSRLQDKIAAASGLWTILDGYDKDSADTLRSARRELVNTCDAHDISGMYAANEALDAAFADGAAALWAYSLDGSESDSLNDYVISFDGAQRAIEQNGYNESVQSFNRSTMDKLPASFLADIVGVESPELFK